MGKEVKHNKFSYKFDRKIFPSKSCFAWTECQWCHAVLMLQQKFASFQIKVLLKTIPNIPSPED